MSSSPNQARIPMLNVARQTAAVRPQLDAAIARVLDHGFFINGPEVRELEHLFAAYCGSRFAVACASGTDAILLPLMALGAGPGDVVVTTPFTFFATAGCISRVGATPVFVDIEPGTFNMDPERLGAYLGSLEPEARGRVKAIIPVDLFGQCARLDRIGAIAAQYGIPVIEDAAQAVGAELQGRRSGSLSLCGTFSFFPAKNLGAAGDGGMMTTDDEAFAARLRILREHGGEQRYYHRMVGINSRLDTLQAAILLAKFDRLEKWTVQRQGHAEFYRSQLADVAQIQLPAADPDARHVYNQFTIRTTDRDRVQRAMDEAGVASAIYYPVPLHLQECFAGLGYKPGNLPESERAAQEVLSIPIDPDLTAEERDRVVRAVRTAATETVAAGN